MCIKVFIIQFYVRYFEIYSWEAKEIFKKLNKAFFFSLFYTFFSIEKGLQNLVLLHPNHNFVQRFFADITKYCTQVSKFIPGFILLTLNFVISLRIMWKIYLFPRVWKKSNFWYYLLKYGWLVLCRPSNYAHI